MLGLHAIVYQNGIPGKQRGPHVGPSFTAPANWAIADGCDLIPVALVILFCSPVINRAARLTHAAPMLVVASSFFFHSMAVR